MMATTTPWALLLAALALSACGGGSDSGHGHGGGQASTPKLEGAYQGVTNHQLAIRSLTLENGDSWILYGPQVNGALVASGMAVATQERNDGSTYTARIRDYYHDGQVFDGSLSGSYVAGQSFRGTISSNGLTTPFTANAVKPSEYDYQAPASLSRIAGSWSGATLAGHTGQITIDTAGALQGSLQACSVTGQVKARASGKNVFDVTMNFGPAPCTQPGQQLKGIAVNDAAASGGSQLIVMATTAAGTAGTAFLASR